MTIRMTNAGCRARAIVHNRQAVDLRSLNSSCRETGIDGLGRKAAGLVVTDPRDARERVFGCGSHDLPVHRKGGGSIAMATGNSEDSHACLLISLQCAWGPPPPRSRSGARGTSLYPRAGPQALPHCLAEGCSTRKSPIAR